MAKNKTIRLYHYTSVYHWPAILDSQVICRTESNIDPEKAYPNAVVWLTDEAKARQEWQNGSIVDKSAIRITVEIPDSWAARWEFYARRLLVPQWWQQALAKAGGSPETWLVCEKEIPAKYWLRVETTDNNEILYEKEPAPAALSAARG